ncbi:MAG: Blue-light-activated protein, partial [Actinobacteria bacterium]|nr:Blue-light-activated protein [Actinomycetota bacterium]
KKTRIKVTVDPVFDARGRLSGAIHYLSDITPIKEAEKAAFNEIVRLGLLSRLKMQVIREPDLDAFLNEAMRDVCRSLELSRCAVWIPGDPERFAESCVPDALPADRGSSFYRSLAGKEEDFAGGNVVVGDVSASSRHSDLREELERFGVGAFLIIPLRRGEEWFGFLFFSRGEAHAWTEPCVVIAESVGRTIAIAVQHSMILRSQQELAGRMVSLMNNIPGAVYRGLRDWSVVFMGADIKRMLGYSPEEFTAGHVDWRSVMHPDDLEPIRLSFREAVREGKRILRVEYRVLHRDGGVRWLSDRRMLVYDDEGKFRHVDGLLLDITDRKVAEEKHYESEYRFQALADTATDGIVSVNSAGKIVFLNSTAEKLFGYKKAAAEGGSVFLLIPERYRIAHAEGMARFLATGEPRIIGKTVELHGLRKDGTEFPLELSLATWNTGQSVYFTGIVRDITERKRAEQELRETHGKLQSLIESSPTPIVALTNDGIVTMWNPAAEHVFGWNAEELIGRMLPIVPNEVEFLKLRERVIREGGFSGVEVRRQRKDGSFIDVRLSSGAMLDSAGIVVGMMGIYEDVTERKRAEEELRTTHDKLQSLVDNSPIPIVAMTADGTMTMWNPAAERAFGWSSEEIIGQQFPMVPEGKEEEFRMLKERVFREGGFSGVEVTRERKDGSFVDIRLATGPIRDPGGAVVGVVGIMEDITDRKKMEKALHDSEEQLRQSQKIEAIGQLAGGVAHDFNNLLTAIRGYSDLLLHRLDAGSPLRREVEEIQKAGERASSLTRQLLAFSRKQVLQPKVLDLNAVVANMDMMLRRLIGEDIDLLTVLRPGLWSVKVDPGQVEQVIMNLIVNARDAMPKGGKLTIETMNTDLGDAYVRSRLVVTEGSYVMLSVSDTGEGMNENTRSRLFEPFFTTKEKGKGTGLGLSTVYGIVKQSGGYIWVYSEPGKGATFKVYFPRVLTAAESVKEGTKEPLLRGKETVLVVEDEETVRSLVRDVLIEHGYTVLTAIDGQDAIKIGREYKEPIHLIVTDVVMPKTGGREAVESLAPHLPGVKVLYMSGYTDDAIVHHGVLDKGISFLQKPFTPDSLLRKVREVLETPPAG